MIFLDFLLEYFCNMQYLKVGKKDPEIGCVKISVSRKFGILMKND